MNASVPQHIKQTPHLEDLNLMSNPWLDVTDDVIGDFLSLSGLQVLKLGDMHHGNVLTEKGIEMLAELDGLKSLSLAFFNWWYTGTGLNPLLRLTRLQSLDLQGCNNVDDTTLTVIGGMSSIKSLHLDSY